jgi:sulfur carrier protein ThiS adenylyltransferase
MDAAERYSRQTLLVPDGLRTIPISIIGCGAIGRNVAVQLVSMGAENIELYDFDTVEESNVASQGFPEQQIGMSKVEAVEMSCKAINSQCSISVKNERFVKSSSLHGAVFLCVDTMEGRTLVSSAAQRQRVNFVIDGRMSGETARILSFEPTNSEEYTSYTNTLMSDEQAHEGACTAKSTIYCSNIISGFMVSILTKWIKKLDSSFDKDFMLDINNREIFTIK